MVEKIIKITLEKSWINHLTFLTFVSTFFHSDKQSNDEMRAKKVNKDFSPSDSTTGELLTMHSMWKLKINFTLHSWPASMISFMLEFTLVCTIDLFHLSFIMSLKPEFQFTFQCIQPSATFNRAIADAACCCRCWLLCISDKHTLKVLNLKCKSSTGKLIDTQRESNVVIQNVWSPTDLNRPPLQLWSTMMLLLFVHVIKHQTGAQVQSIFREHFPVLWLPLWNYVMLACHFFRWKTEKLTDKQKLFPTIEI